MESHPHIEEVRRTLEKWKEMPARILYVQDEAFKVIEVSTVALETLIDLLKDAEQGIVRREAPSKLYRIVERITGIRRMYKKEAS